MAYNVTLKMDITEAQPQMSIKQNTQNTHTHTHTESVTKMREKEMEFQSLSQNPEKVNENPHVNRYQSCD